jgi:ABC-type nickel/cobalt efflux system permease component RcnA
MCIRTRDEPLSAATGPWRKRRSRMVAGLALFLLCGAVHADTVASLLGNFTINQYCGLMLGASSADGVTSQAERDAYVGKLAAELAGGLNLDVDGVRVPLETTRWTSSLPAEQGGFSLRVDVDLAARLPAVPRGAHRRLEFSNQNYAGRMGWHEIVVQSAPGLAVFDTNAHSSSLTDGLSNALQALPSAGPLDERAVHLTFTEGGPPAGAAMLAARPSGEATDHVAAANPPQAGSAGAREGAWIARETRRLVEAISGPTLPPRIAILALLGAMILGAVHALSPGHGKTIVGAYLIGSRGTPRHAVFLGSTVTVTHTFGVFVLGFATLYASRFIAPERLVPILSLASAALVLGMGVVLLVQRARAAYPALSVAKKGGIRFHPVAAAGGPADGRRLILPTHGHLEGVMHSHGGGPMHSHMPPGASGETVTWRSLLTLGISGGLVPCPSAMVLLLAAVALNKTAYGMALVIAFSVGLAITLTAVGLAFLYARNRFRKPRPGSRWPQFLPVLSAGMITLLGIGLSIAALRNF